MTGSMIGEAQSGFIGWEAVSEALSTGQVWWGPGEWNSAARMCGSWIWSRRLVGWTVKYCETGVVMVMIGKASIRYTIYIMILIITTIVSHLYYQDSHIILTPPGINVNQLKSGYAVGSINNIKLKIPNKYLFSGVRYEGDHPLSTATRTNVPNYESKIIGFGMLVRMPNLSPIENKDDYEDYRRNSGPNLEFEKDDWIIVSVGFKDHADLKQLFHINNIKKKFHDTGDYIVHNNKSYGLTYAEEINPEKRKLKEKQIFLSKREYFYDNEAMKTIIDCKTTVTELNGRRILTCDHYFSIPTYNIYLRVMYNRHHIYDWRKIEMRLKEIIDSFVE